MSQPALYLSNWSSHSTPGHHGPGRRISGMALPREWEKGDGVCSMVSPDPNLLRKVQAGEMAIRRYLLRYEAKLEAWSWSLRHGHLRFCPTDDPAGERLVEDGDSILCACARPAPRGLFPSLGPPETEDGKLRHPCHLEVLAPALVLWDWDVRLYGVRLVREGSVVRREGEILPYSWDPL